MPHSAIILLALAAATPAPLTGTWVERGPLTTFDFAPCSRATCATLVDSPFIKADADARDVKNPDVRLRTHRLKGLTIMRGLSPTRAGWRGSIYFPSRGKSYPVTLRRTDTRTLDMSICLTRTDCHAVTLDQKIG